MRELLLAYLRSMEYEVIRAAVVPWSVVRARAKPIPYNNGYRIHMASGLLSLPEVVDVTEAVRRASQS